MSRMFRVITGNGSSEVPTDPRVLEALDGDPFAGDAVPYVEVGGPNGPTTSIAPPAKPVPAPAPTVFTPPMRPMPQPVAKPEPLLEANPDSKFLSVTFHRVPKAGVRLMQSGIAPEIVAYHFPDHPVTSEYRKVRDSILDQFEEPGSRVALFTASTGTAGTTTVLVNFAVSLCMEHGSRVLLVDTNFERPGVARRLSCSESPGLAEVLGQSIPLAWALQPTPLTNLHVLATGTPQDGTEEAFITDFPRLIGQLRQWFDWVIIDGGVWYELPGAEALSATCDGCYLVTRHNHLEQAEFSALRAEVTTSGGQVRGYISTKQ